MELANKVFGYLNKYPNQEYAINPQLITVDMEYKKVEMKMDFRNQHSYFQ